MSGEISIIGLINLSEFARREGWPFDVFFSILFIQTLFAPINVLLNDDK